MTCFTIPTQLPSLNEYQDACRSHWSKGREFKANTEALISLYIRKALRDGSLEPAEGQVDLVIVYNERTLKRDTDNIQSASKFILDSMRACGIIKNDSRKHVRQIYPVIEDGAKADSVDVYIFPAGELRVKFIERGSD